MFSSVRAGLTLVELMVAITILVVISGAMLGVLFAATRLYEVTEASRAATDEIMAVVSRLDADIGRAVPARQGGHFYAELPSDPSYSAVIGWTIRDPSPLARPDATKFVVWGLETGDHLRRVVLDSCAPLTNGNGLGQINGRGEIVAEECLAFSVRIVGTTDVDKTTPRTLRPKPEDWWESAITDQEREVECEPRLRSFYCTLPHGGGTANRAYPLAARFTLLLASTARFQFRARIVGADDVTVDSASIRIVAPGGVPAGIGNVCRIGPMSGQTGTFEIIGYNRFDGAWLYANQSTQDGPCGERTGRGALRTDPSAHGRATEEIRFGRTFNLVRSFPQE